MEEIELLKHRIETEQTARKDAESILEEKVLALSTTIEHLKDLNENLA